MPIIEASGRRMTKIIGILFFFGILGCEKIGKPTDSAKERARAEQEVLREYDKERSRKEQEAARESENKAQAEKAQKMEAELAAWHNYYSALEGQFTAEVLLEGRSYRLQFIFLKSIPAFSGGRVRQLSEIETDKNNLNFQVTVNHWEENNDKVVEGSNVRCDGNQIKFQSMDSGSLIVSAACKYAVNTYAILFSQSGLSTEKVETVAKNVAGKINKNELQKVDWIVGEIRLSSNPKHGIPFRAKRVI